MKEKERPGWQVPPLRCLYNSSSAAGARMEEAENVQQGVEQSSGARSSTDE